MNQYTDARSTPGLAIGGSDDKGLFLRTYGEMVLEAWDETFEFLGDTFVKEITAGKSATFPIIGRKRDAVEHVPGELILGGGIQHSEVEITLDPILVESAFIAEIDELLAHYPLARPYARQIGESLANVTNTRIARMLVLASRETDAPYPGGPLPSYHYHTDMLTDASKLEEAAFKGVEHIRENDIGGGQMKYRLPWQQQLLLARYTGIDTVDTAGSGNRAAGTVGQIAGLPVIGTNHIPTGTVSTGNTKYRGTFTNTVGIISNGMAVGTLRRRGIRVTQETQNDRLGTLMIGSKMEGHGQLRPECAFEVANASR